MVLRLDVAGKTFPVKKGKKLLGKFTYKDKDYFGL